MTTERQGTLFFNAMTEFEISQLQGTGCFD